ncbi:MAG: STAS domain-containing protein [Pseudomonadota bacterium]
MYSEGHPCRLRLEGELTIAHAAGHHQILLEALSRCPELEVDLGGVQDIDTAGVQILLVLKREAARAGQVLRFVAHGPAVVRLLDRYNLVAELGDPLLIPG